MNASRANAQDPLPYQAFVCLIFALLVLSDLGIPSKMYFDEVHYVPAARLLLHGLPANPEHPLLAKEAMALAIRLMGDRPLAWRLPGAIMGVVGLFAFGRALWWISGRRMAALSGTILVASDFAWFVQSRIAMLDMVMAGFTMLGLWMAASAVALPGNAKVGAKTVAKAGAKTGASPGARRWRLALAGVCFGLALGAKWSALPVVAVVAGGLIGARLWRRDGRPIPGLGLPELLLWSAILPLLTYALSFWPAFFYARDALSPLGLIGWQFYMLDLQSSVIKHHPYQSVWWQWVINWRAIWYLYEPIDGAQRGIILIGNPFTMLAGLAGLVWCGWAALWRGRRDAALVVVLYVACLGLWVVGKKPVQFYYHYLLPGTFLMAALALAVDALWMAGLRWRREALGVLVLSIAVFAWFWPILAAAPLHKGAASFQDWMWLASWR